MNRLKLILLAILLMACSSYFSFAQENEGPGGTSNFKSASAQADDRNYIIKDEWRFFVAPYMWLVGNNISMSKQGPRGATVAVDVPWYDFVPDYFTKVFGAMTRIEVWKGRWGFFVDNVYLYVTDTASGGGSRRFSPNSLGPLDLGVTGDAKIIVRQGFLDVGGRYLLGALPLSSGQPLPLLSFELLGGLRYNWYNQSGNLAVNATVGVPAAPLLITKSKGIDLSIRYMVIEPFLGLRTGFWFTDKLNLLLRADIGGFGIVAYQDFNSNLEALAGYKVHDQIRLYLGYRGRYYYFNKGSDAIKSYGWYHGPVVGAVFSF
jgi:hypothetical protein